MYMSKHLKVEANDTTDPCESYDFDGKKAEAKWMRTILPQTLSKFSKTYNGSHFQDLPAEILQVIALYCSVSSQPEIRAFRAEEAFCKFRTLCKATSEAGKASLRHRFRRRQRGPHELCVTHNGRTLEQTLAIFKDTGLGPLVTDVRFNVMPVIMHPQQKQLLVEYFQGKQLRRQAAAKRAVAVVEELENAIQYQESFFDMLKTHAGFNKVIDILDCLPNLEELQVHMSNFWYFARDSMILEALTDDWALKRHTKVAHWRLMPQIFQLIERYGIRKLRLEADSSILGEVLARRFTGASRTNSRRLPTITPTILTQSCHSLTHIELSMTYMDYACLGQLSEGSAYGLQNGTGFRTLLSSAVNLDSLHLVFSLEHGGLNEDNRINAPWLHEVLRDQYWPKLKHFHLFSSEANLATLGAFFRAHKRSLTSIVMYSILSRNASGMVELLNMMREELSLKRCDVTDFDFTEDDVSGIQAWWDICREYKRDPLTRKGTPESEDDHGTDSEDSDLDEGLDSLEPGDINFGLWVLRRDTRGRVYDDSQAQREYAEDDDNSDKEFI